MKISSLFVVPATTAIVFAAAALAAAPPKAAAPAPGATAPAQGLQILDFKPAFSDQMTMLIQPRHTKLWYAGQQQNWVLAAFELNELGAAFTRIAHSIPKYRGVDVAPTMASIMGGGITAVDQAIKARDPRQFTQAFGRLTADCNACHQGLDHPFIVTKTPEAGAYPDQDFRPQGK